VLGRTMAAQPPAPSTQNLAPGVNMRLGPLQISWTGNVAAGLAPPKRTQQAAPLHPETEARRAPETVPVGLPGTPIFHGFMRDFGEYNPQLEGLTACELPIRAAH
jgi:hypothetical protein